MPRLSRSSVEPQRWSASLAISSCSPGKPLSPSVLLQPYGPALASPVSPSRGSAWHHAGSLPHAPHGSCGRWLSLLQLATGQLRRGTGSERGVHFMHPLARCDLRYQKSPDSGYFWGLGISHFFPCELYLLCFMPFQLVKGFQGTPYVQIGGTCTDCPLHPWPVGLYWSPERLLCLSRGRP